MIESTIIAFPTYIGAMTGVSYLRVGVRKVWVTLTDGSTCTIPRKLFPDLVSGNDSAFVAARLITDGPAAPLPTRVQAEDAWLRAYIARMVERGVDKEYAKANADSLERSKIDLTVHPESAADDEMSYWDADE